MKKPISLPMFCFITSICFVLSWSNIAPAQFDTVFNVPPERDPGSIDSNTQLNVFANGVIGDGFSAGVASGLSENVEVNIFGGIVGDFFSGNEGSTTNIYGGVVGNNYDVRPFSELNVFNGELGNGLVGSGGTLNVYGDADVSDVVLRSFSFLDEPAVMNMFGGRVTEITMLDGLSATAGSRVNLFDGRLEQGFNMGPFVTAQVVVNGATVLGECSGAGTGNVQMLSGSVDKLAIGNSVGSPGNRVDVFGGTIESLSVAKGTSEGVCVHLDFYGLEFQLFDPVSGELLQDITPLMQFGIPFLLEDRDVLLRGRLADGQSFEYELRVESPEIDPDFLNLHLAQTVGPTAFEVIRGFQVAGDFDELTFSDDQRLGIQPGFTLNDTEPPVWVTADLISPVSTPANLRLMVEANANSPNLTQSIELWNWSTGEFELARSMDSSFTADRLRIVDLTDNIENYLEPGSRTVRVRGGWVASGFVLLFPWQINIDQIALSVD